MSAAAIAIRYAKAGFMYAHQLGQQDEFCQDMEYLASLVRENTSLRGLLRNPLMTSADLSLVTDKLFKGRLKDGTLYFLNFLVHKGRIALLDEIAMQMVILKEQEQGILKAIVESALPLEEQTRQEIGRVLAQKFNKKMVIEWKISRSILGGYRIIVDGQLFDYSFYHQLNHYYQHVLS